MPSRRRRQRVTLLKIRVRPLVRMPKSRLFDLVLQACQNGVVPKEIEITTLNWDHEVGQRYQPGQELSGKDRQELRNCYAYLAGSSEQRNVRVEHPR